MRRAACFWLVVACCSMPLGAAAQRPAAAKRPTIGGLLSSGFRPRAAEPELDEIAALIGRLAAHSQASVAARALATARRGLRDARVATAGKQVAAAARAKQVAWAALALASRQIAVAVAERVRAHAERRAQRAQAALLQAEHALEVARGPVSSHPAGAP